MIRNLLLVAIVIAAFSGRPARAAIVQFALDAPNGLVFGNQFTDVYSGLVADGVTFDATITVTGSGTLDQNTTGLGVVGGLSGLINTDESLQFSVAIANEAGGTVNFDGFTGMDYTAFTTGATGDADVAGASTTGNNPADLVASTGNDPTFNPLLPNNVFIVGGTATTGGGTSFRVEDVFASFTGTTAAVPEPSALALTMLGGLMLVRRRRRVRDED